MLPHKKRTAAADAYVTGADGLEDATPHEEMMLLAASGVTILQLNAALGGEQPVQGMYPSHPPDRAAIEDVRSRVRRRRRLGLPHVDCLTPDCSCGSLASALVEPRLLRRQHDCRKHDEFKCSVWTASSLPEGGSVWPP